MRLLPSISLTVALSPSSKPLSCITYCLSLASQYRKLHIIYQIPEQKSSLKSPLLFEICKFCRFWLLSLQLFAVYLMSYPLTYKLYLYSR